VRKATLWTLLVLMLGLCLGQTALAQNMPMNFCSALSEADCAILTEAQQASAALQSSSVHFDLNMSVANIPQMPVPLDFGITGDGAFSGSMSQAMMGIYAQATPDMAQLPQMMEDALRAFNGQMSFTIHLPQMLMQMMMANMPRTTPMPPPPSDISFDVRMVGGIGYINLSKIADAFPSANVPTGWQGIDVAGLYRAVLEQQMSTAGMTTAMNDMMQQVMGMMSDGTNSFGDFVTVKRGEDTTVDGQNAAVFNYTFDFVALLSSPMMEQMLTSVVPQRAQGDGSQMTPEQLHQAMDMAIQLYKGIEFTMRETVGLDDHYVHSMEMHMNWDMTSLMALTTASSGTTPQPTPAGPAPLFTLDLGVAISDFNSAPTITAPEGATVIPLEQVLPMLQMPGMTGTALPS